MNVRTISIAAGLTAVGCAAWLLSPGPPAVAQPAGPKNVILLIGDGMGPQQLALLFDWSDAAGKGETGMQSMANAGTFGMLRTGASDTPVTDSAAAATALACGVKTNNGMISVTPQAKAIGTCLEDAEKTGRVTGLVTSTRITHATPACFGSHVPNRGMEQEIARQLFEESGVEVMLGGGAAVLDAKVSHAGADLRAVAKNAGYSIIGTPDELAALKPGAGKTLGLFSMSHLPYVIDRDEPGEDVTPTLTQLTSKALELLGGSDKGFFLMVEGGRIDHAGHGNDVAGVLGEMREFDDTVKVALAYQKAHPDTLVVVTADHETGGLCITYGRERFKPEHLLGIAAARTSVGRLPAEQMVNVTSGTQLGIGRTPFYPQQRSWSYNATALARSSTWNVSFGSGGHTTTPVTVTAVGPGEERFAGFHENTHVGKVLREFMQR